MAEPGDTLKARIWRRMLPGFFPRSLAPCRRFRGRSIWEVIGALQTLMPLHLGIDSKNVCDKVGRLVGVGHKVKTDDVVVDGRVRGGHIGNDAADVAAEFGRFRQQPTKPSQTQRRVIPAYACSRRLHSPIVGGAGRDECPPSLRMEGERSLHRCTSLIAE